MSRADTFHCVERIIPLPDAHAFVLGTMESSVIRTSPKLGHFSPKSRDELLGASSKNAKLALVGGAASTVVGLALTVTNALL